ADIEVEGDEGLQQALRFALFHLYQAAARNEGRAIPGKGLTGSGYDGHAFWDTEAFVLPVLTFTAPRTVRSALEWRHSTLDSARERARALGLRGAALPWRTIHGEECSGYWPAGTAAFHVNAAVAAAVRRYVSVTDDREFEERTGCELLVESARLWASLGYHDERGDFRIDGVTGPDEYSALVDNNVYTNLMAQLNLRSAVEATGRHPEAARRLGVDAEERDEWQRAADAMFVPYDEERGLHPQDQDFLEHRHWDFENTPPDRYPLLLHYPYFQLYRQQVIKQSDLVLAMHWRGDAFTPEQKQANFDYYEQLTVRDSSLSASTQSVLAAEVGHLGLARAYLEEAARMDLDDLAHNTADGLHMASLAGAVLAAVAGFGGVRDYDHRLAFRPRLPDDIERLLFSMEVRGSLLRVEIASEEARYSLVQGDPLRFLHWGEETTLDEGGDIRLPIPPLVEEPAPQPPPAREPRAGRYRGSWPRSAVEAHGGQGLLEAGVRGDDQSHLVAPEGSDAL
ncbi:MAG TPA: glycosyl hydrolase family 65 protein, partial [Thermoleophilaceae bacterium]|nr:glycosyl hydrolase family 65 protein [Thermoleophilaceae bacterium]